MTVAAGPAPAIAIEWLLICAVLVMLMQAGFSCLETGLVRAKNSINVAIKNLVDFCIASVLFGLFGFALMFGASWAGLVGTDHFIGQLPLTPWGAAFFFFQMMFCGTATTIVSGAVAERMTFVGYAVLSAVVAGIVYPIAGHWSWGGVFDPAAGLGFLKALGFHDFAGSTVVHSLGGWCALAAIVTIGPRIGRFGPGGGPIEGYSLPISTLGVFLLWFGWFGFNGGSTFVLDGRVPGVMVNTGLGGAAGGLAAMIACYAVEGRPLADRIMNGTLAGLVAVTGPCDVISSGGALLIGAVAGALCVLAAEFLAKFRIDDAVGAVPVHLFAGIWGTLAVALFAADEHIPAGLSRLQFLGVQALGVAAVGAFAFSVAWLALRLIGLVIRLRVSPEDEMIGLNVSEHNASTAVLDLLTQMQGQARDGRFTAPVRVEPGTEAASIADFYNAVLARFNLEQARRQMAHAELAATNRALTDANARLADREAKARRAGAVKDELVGMLAHDMKTPLSVIAGHVGILQHQIDTASDGTLPGARVAASLAAVQRAQDRLAGRIETALAEMAEDATDLAVTLRPIELGGVVTEVVAGCRPLADRKEQTLALAIEPGIVIEADRFRLAEAIENLVTNAIKYSPLGSPIGIAVERVPDAAAARIAVRDAGPGLTDADKARLFRRFERLSAQPTGSESSTGLGLAIAKRIVELHAGSIAAESDGPGRGATFVITLPLDSSEAR